MASMRTMKQNDTRPLLVTTLTIDGVAVNLTGASIRLLKRVLGSGPAAGAAVVGTVTITTPASGIVTWTPSATDTSTVGSFELEWEVTYSDGGIQTFPTEGYDTLVIVDDIV